MIWSVSTLLRRNGTAVPVCTVNSSICGLLQLGGAGKVSGDRRRGRDEWRHQMGATALALSSLEIAIGGRRTAFARGELVGVHAEAHRTAGLAPLRACRDKDRVQSLS